MEEEIKKRGRGRPRKGEVVPKAKPRRKKDGRGGKREGAGRKKGVSVAYEGDMLSSQITLRVRDITKERVVQLRELTKYDDMSFNRLLEAWVEEMAKKYGLD